MNDTQKKVKKTKTKIDSATLSEKLNELDRVLLGLNATGSLDLKDYTLITNYLKGSFGSVWVDAQK
jgi:hypothetical protein